MAVAFVSTITPWQAASPAVSGAFSPTAANTLVGGCINAGNTTNSVAGSGTNPSTFAILTPPGQHVDLGNDNDICFDSLSCAGGSQTITTSASGGNMFNWAWQYSGASTVAAAATDVNAPGTGAGAIKGASVTVPTGAILLALCVDVFNAGTITSPAGTNRGSGALAGVNYCATEYAGTGAAIQPTFTTATGADLFVVLQWLISPAASGAIAGTAAITFGQSGAIAGGGALAGSTAITFGQSGTLAGAGAIAGTAAVTFGTSATLAGAGALAASAAVTFGANGTLAASGALAASAGFVFGASGTLTPPSGAIAGTAAFAFDGSATLSGAGSLAASAPITFGTSGALQGSGALAALSGIVFGASGTLIPPGAIIGTASITFDGSATPQGAGSLAGSGSITFNASGTLTQPFVPPTVQIFDGGGGGKRIPLEDDAKWTYEERRRWIRLQPAMARRRLTRELNADIAKDRRAAARAKIERTAPPPVELPPERIVSEPLAPFPVVEFAPALPMAAMVTPAIQTASSAPEIEDEDDDELALLELLF